MKTYFQNHTPARLVDIPDLHLRGNVKRENISIVRCLGSCLDHPNSPLRLKDGDHILIYQLDISAVSSWLDNIGKVVCIATKRYGLLIKILTFYSPWFIRLKMLNPDQEFNVPMNDIVALFEVPQVVHRSIINQQESTLSGLTA